MTPANSGLTAGEIASYKAQANNIVAEVNAAKNSLNQIDNIPASSVVGITSNNGQGKLNQGTNSGNNGSTTLGDIVNQENIVAQTTDEVNQLANQIASEATSSPDSSTPSSPPTDNGNYGPGQIQPQNGPIKLIEGENTF